MSLSTRPYKGTRDFYPEDFAVQDWIFSQMRGVVSRYGYHEYNGPILEDFELYAAKTGEEIVHQQIYSFEDRGGRRVAIRPEMTPTLARMVAAKIQELPRPIRWFSLPNLWRYERPQKGRLREHWQLNVDVLGGDSIQADGEVLRVALDLFECFGGKDKIEIQLNHRGLIDFFFQKKLGFSPEVALKVSKAVDAKEKIGKEKYEAWLSELGVDSEQKKAMESFFLSDFSEIEKKYPCEAVDELKSLLEDIQDSALRFDPGVLRGLDYYTGPVFEMYDTSPENKRALFGGGRYDNLVGLFGKQELSGVGFGMGDVTVRDFLTTHKLLPDLSLSTDVFICVGAQQWLGPSLQVAQALRKKGIRVMSSLAVGSLKPQLKSADRQNARLGLIFSDEMKEKKVILKKLQTGEQENLDLSQVAQSVEAILAHH